MSGERPVVQMDTDGQNGTPIDSKGSQLESQWAEWGSTGEVAFELLPDGHYVYVAWGADPERPLYIGKSSNFLARIGSHLRSAPWYSETRRIELHAFSTARDAEWAENEAIHAMNPTYNVTRRLSQAQLRAIRERSERLERERARRDAEKKARLAAAIHREIKRREKAARAVERMLARPKVRLGPDYLDEIPPDQLEIIRKVQNRGRSAARSESTAVRQ